MIWREIHEATERKILVIWQREDWYTITAQVYVDHTLSFVVLFFYNENNYEMQHPHASDLIFMNNSAS